LDIIFIFKSFLKNQNNINNLIILFSMEKKFWRCTVCNDIHYGIAGPEICPTCKEKNVYVEITKEEAARMMRL